jgi:pimeloyl-ACP methyl ester carboxylesterase
VPGERQRVRTMSSDAVAVYLLLAVGLAVAVGLWARAWGRNPIVWGAAALLMTQCGFWPWRSRSHSADDGRRAACITVAHDFLATPALVTDMAQAIPNGEFLEAADAGHAVHHDRPGWLSETVVGW